MLKEGTNSIESNSKQNSINLNNIESLKNNESHSINSTKFDSFTNGNFFNKNSNCENYQIKQKNFLNAINSIQKQLNYTKENISEFSEAQVNLSKEEKIEKYINHPLQKEIIKFGNDIKKIPLNNNKYSYEINKPYTEKFNMNNIFNQYLHKILEIDSDDSENNENNNNNNKEKNNNFISKNKSTAIETNNKSNINNNINNNIEIHPFNLDVINDLEEEKNLDLFNYQNKKDKNNKIKSKNEILIFDSVFESSLNNSNKNKNSFNNNNNNNDDLKTHKNSNISNYQNNLYSNYNIQSKKSNNKNNKFKTFSEKRLRKKFFRSEFKIQFAKNQKNNNNSLNFKDNNNLNNNNNNFENSSSSNIIIAKNLMNKFNSCSKKDSLSSKSKNVNEIKIYEDDFIYKKSSKTPSAELIDFLSENLENKSENKEENKEYLITPIRKISNISNNIFEKDTNYNTNNGNILNNNNNSINKNNSMNNNNNNIFSTPKSKIKEFKICDYKTKPKKTKESFSFEISNSDNNDLNISQFQGQTIYDLSFYNNLLQTEENNKISINSNLIKNHPKLKISDRSEILNWLMQICEEFAFKRDTFHYALNYFDRYLSNSKNIENKNELKLIAITSLSISAKIEEVQIPKLIEYSNSLNNFYGIEDIIKMEQKLVKNLLWKIIPITINTWMNWYICQWDLFIDTIEEIKNKLLNYFKEDEILFFKKSDDKSYYNFRKISQIIDLIAIDYYSLKLEKRFLIAGAIFDVICINYNIEYDLNENKIINYNEKNNVIIEIFKDFLQQSFDLNFDDEKIKNVFEFCYKFKYFSFNFDLPLIYQVEQNDVENDNYEDFISYQTFNDKNIQFLKEINDF